MWQDYDIPFGRPSLARVEIASGEVSPSSDTGSASPSLQAQRDGQQHASSDAHPASGDGTTDPAAASGVAVAAAASAPASAAPAAAEAVASASSSDSPADSTAAGSAATGAAAGREISDGSSSGGGRLAFDMVTQRSLSLTVRTAPSEAQQGDSPTVW